MKRSAQPFPSGARTKAGELAMLRNASSVWKAVRHGLAALIVPDAQAEAISAEKPLKRCRTPWRIGSSASKRVARWAAWMPTHSASSDRWHEHRDLPLGRPGGGQVGAPHRVDPVRDDGAVVVARTARVPTRVGAKQVVGAHRRSTPTLGGAHALHAQPCPDLAMAFAVEGAVGQDGADPQEQCGIRHRPDRAGPRRGIGPGLRSGPERGR